MVPGERTLSEFQKDLIEHASDAYIIRINRLWDLSASETQEYCERIQITVGEKNKRELTTRLHNNLNDIMEEIHRLEFERCEIMRLLENNIKT